jgi:hypothetical protein
MSLFSFSSTKSENKRVEQVLAWIEGSSSGKRKVQGKGVGE